MIMAAAIHWAACFKAVMSINEWTPKRSCIKAGQLLNQAGKMHRKLPSKRLEAKTSWKFEMFMLILRKLMAACNVDPSGSESSPARLRVEVCGVILHHRRAFEAEKGSRRVPICSHVRCRSYDWAGILRVDGVWRRRRQASRRRAMRTSSRRTMRSQIFPSEGSVKQLVIWLFVIALENMFTAIYEMIT